MKTLIPLFALLVLLFAACTTNNNYYTQTVVANADTTELTAQKKETAKWKSEASRAKKREKKCVEVLQEMNDTLEGAPGVEIDLGPKTEHLQPVYRKPTYREIKDSETNEWLGFDIPQDHKEKISQP